MIYLRAAMLLLATIGCNKPDSRPPVRAVARQAQEPAAVPTDSSLLIAVDSLAFSTEGSGARLYRFAVLRPEAVDTIPDVMAWDWPVLVGDSLVTGVTVDTVTLEGAGFRYDLRHHRLDTIPLPVDLLIWRTRVTFSSDGGHVAYVSFAGDGTGRGVVRSWPDHQLRVETPLIRVPATDALVGAAVWWGASEFQIGITCEDGGSAWFRGTLHEGIVTWKECPSWARVWIAERSTDARLVFRIEYPGGIGISLVGVGRCPPSPAVVWMIVSPKDDVELEEVVYGKTPGGWEALVPASRLETGCYVAWVGPGANRIEFTIARDGTVREMLPVP